MNLDLLVFFSRSNLPKIKDGANVINLDDKNSKGKHWVSFFLYKNVAIYFDSFGIECIPQEVLSEIRDQSITHNIFIIMNLLCVGFIVSLS